MRHFGMAASVFAVVILAFAQCSDSNANNPVEPALEIREGDVVTGTIITTVYVGGTNEANAWTKQYSAAFSADVNGRMGWLSQSNFKGAVALTRASSSMPTSEHVITRNWTDKNGVSQELRITTSGRRILSVAHDVDGEKFSQRHYDWRQIDGGWLLESRTTSMFKDGEPLHRIEQRITESTLASRAILSTGKQIASTIISCLGPAPLRAATVSTMDHCGEEKFDVSVYAAVAAGFGYSCPATAGIGCLGAVMAIMAYEDAVDEYIACTEEH